MILGFKFKIIVFQISALSQSWADEQSAKGVSLFDGGSPHAPMEKGKGVYNAENMGESPNVAASIKMYYDEIKNYDFNNQGGKTLMAQGGKVVGILLQLELNFFVSINGEIHFAHNMQLVQFPALFDILRPRP